MVDLEVVGLKNNLLYDFKVNDIKNKIVSRINALSLNNPKYKHDIEFLKLVTNLIEFLVVKKDNINKSELCYLIFMEVFDLNSEEEKVMLKHNIDSLHANGSIKTVSFWKLFKCGVKEYLNPKKG